MFGRETVSCLPSEYLPFDVAKCATLGHGVASSKLAHLYILAGIGAAWHPVPQLQRRYAMRKAAPGTSRTLTIALGDTLVDWLRSKTHQGALSLGAVVRMELTKAKEGNYILDTHKGAC